MSFKGVADKFFVFFSASFSGGYKIFAVFLITLLFSESTVREFNTLYFIVLMCVSLGVMPIASMMTARNFALTGAAKFFWLLLFSCVACVLVSFFQQQLAIKLDAHLFTVLLISVLFVGGYEVARRELANNSAFRQVFICGFISTLLFLSVFVASWYELNEPFFLILLLSVCFGLPVIGSLVRSQRNSAFFGGLAPAVFFKQYASSCLSNSTSSLISFLLPLGLVALLQADISPYLAVIFSAANLCMLVPRYMAEKNIPLLRSGGDQAAIAAKTFYITAIYFLVISLAALVIFYLMAIPDFLLYFLLFAALQLTQLTLPYSNVLMVAGQLPLLLKSNLLGLLPFLLLLLHLFYPISELQLSYALVVLYILSSLLKLILGRLYCQQVLNSAMQRN